MTTQHSLRISVVPRTQKIQPSVINSDRLSCSKPTETLLRPLSTPSISLKPKQDTNDEKHMKNPIESRSSIDNPSNNSDKIPQIETTPKTKTIVIALGVVVALAALAGLGIGLYTLIGNSKTTTASTNSSSDWTWCSTGTTVAGTGVAGSLITQLSGPYYVFVDSNNALYIADTGNHRISKWTSGSMTGTVIAGQVYPQAGSNLSLFNQPYGIYIDSARNMYVADTNNHRVMLWNNSATSGIVVAGNGSSGSALNQLSSPMRITFDESSNKLYVADYGNHRVLGIQLSTSTTFFVAGGIGAGYSSAHLYWPVDVYLDSSTNSLYICNYGAHTIVRWVIGATGWTLVAGSPNVYSGSSMALYNPYSVTFDSAGNMYVADLNNVRIQFFRPGSAIGKTIAGATGMTGSTSSLFYNPRAVAVDSQFNLYVTDTSNNRIQMFRKC